MAIESDHEEINLNDEQKFVVEDEDIKFLSVQAGPGSGKTRVLVEKVKHMVNTLKVEAETFLIITFAEKAAEEFVEKLFGGEYEDEECDCDCDDCCSHSDASDETEEKEEMRNPFLK